METGDGYSYGLELLFEKRTGKTTGWIGYTLSWTNRQFENLNNGEEFPYRYDRRHDISFVVTHKFNERVDVGLVWVYGTGNAVTLALQKYNALGDNPSGSFFGGTEVEHIAERNGYRMPGLSPFRSWGESAQRKKMGRSHLELRPIQCI